MAASRHASQRGRRFLLYSSDCGLVLVRGNFSALIGRVCYLRTCFLAGQTPILPNSLILLFDNYLQ